MFGSDILDVGIGMSLLFLMMSLIATSIREAIESLMKSRAGDLEKGLREMLDDREKTNFSGLVGQLYNHPLISSLYKGTLADAKSSDLPSYIPSKTFVSALLDIVLSSTPSTKAAAQSNNAAPNTNPAGPSPADSEGKDPLPQAARDPLTIAALKLNANNLPPRLKSIVLSAIDDGQNDIAAVRKNLEGWFDSTMDRVSGWYRRRTQLILFLIGIASAALLNVDAITVITRLTVDKTLREAIVATAQTPGAIPAVNTPGAAPAANAPAAAPAANAPAAAPAANTAKSYDDLVSELKKIGYPVGWTYLNNKAYPQPQMCSYPKDKNTEECNFSSLLMLKIIIGWLITAFAIMLGAPFWFDVLNKFMVVRSTIKPSEKSPNEASKDNPAAPAPVTLLMQQPAAAPLPDDGTGKK